MTSSAGGRSPLAAILLALLFEAPMHPYRMQHLIKERQKDQVANVAQRNSVYQTISRLQRDGLIAVRETTRAENRPERTVYEITDAGREAFLEWMRTTLSTPAREFPMFPAALSNMVLLEPREVARLLEQRADAIEVGLTDHDALAASGALPRMFLIDDEYRFTLIRTEVAWLRGVVRDLRSGALTWSPELLRTFMDHDL
ncbi:MAG TPA: PadR family transcriptional regulator [Actinophytocola sp.]|uniref:PadR family transcriptional regulator n=1 Tax=Actinophytocola sp. TaxID=1872138 RepID=UPI002DC04360|nr:PadR family transcriptional regulator [Actinophytocola sp.]HEU5469570.1 PadR family transcriptional regulator [Actinophytocola sp.]